MKSRKYNLTIYVFAIYMLLLIWLVLFKFALSIEGIPHIRNINLIPFSQSVIVNNKIELSEIIYNILVFVPFGVYIRILFPALSPAIQVLCCCGLSLFFEVIQYAFAIGASDITDVIANTVGGIIGILFFSVISRILKDKAVKIINVLGLVIEILAFGLLGIIQFANMQL